MTPSQVALNQRRLSKAYGKSDLTFDWDAGLSQPVLCSFNDHEDGPELVSAVVGGIDLYPMLSDKQVAHIESIAYSHLERQAEQINAERRAAQKEFA